MNMLSLLQPNNHCGKESMEKLLEEYQLELNPGNAHIVIRTEEKALAEEYAKRLFPLSYTKEGADGSCFVHLSRGETDNNNAVGIITKQCVPKKWVISRRLENIQKAA